MKTSEVNEKTAYEIAFVSSACNEEENLQHLYVQCLNVFEKLCVDHSKCQLAFSLQLVDNSSSDRTPEVIQ